ncbi:hypothetical protein P691DRAFT_709938, partial [Macrolepiota fuliginosa MF-IS2]
MGRPGSGKSYFIDLLADQHGRHSRNTLKSVTGQVEVICVHHHKCGRIVLVEFPGFGDPARPDLEVLKTTSNWLRTAYERKINLGGIIYLHPITDILMTELQRKNLELFDALCGDVAMSRALIVMTMWQTIDQDVSAARGDVLRDSFFKSFIDRGATLSHLGHGSPEEVWHIIEILLGAINKRAVLRIQKELVDCHRSLHETTAYRRLYAKLQQDSTDQNESVRILLAQHQNTSNVTPTNELKGGYQRIQQQPIRTLE